MRNPDVPSRHDPLLGLKAVMGVVGISKQSIYRLKEKGLFPQSIQLTPGGTRVAWRESEVLAWAAAPLEWGDLDTIISA